MARASHPCISNCIFAILICQIACFPVFATSEEVLALEDPILRMHQIDYLSKQSLLKLVELNRFILRYRLEARKHPPLRNLRYFITQEGGAASFLTLNAVLVPEFAKNLQNPANLNRNHVRAGLETVGAGNIVAGGGSLLELSSNLLRSARNTKRGLDSRAADKCFRQMVDDIDNLIARRDQIAQAYQQDKAYKLIVEEGKALTNLRNFLALMYLHFRQHVAGQTAYENSYYLLNVLGHSVAATSIYLGVKGLTVPRWNGPAFIVFTTSGVIFSVAPALSIVYGHLKSKQASNQFLERIGAQPALDFTCLDRNRKTINDLYNAADPSVKCNVGPVMERFELYGEEGSRFRLTIASEIEHMRELAKAALQSEIYGPIVGSSAAAQGSLGIISYYAYSRSPSVSGRKRALAVNFSGATTGLVGGVIDVGKTTEDFISSELYIRKLHRERQTLPDLIAHRFVELGKIEQKINALQPELCPAPAGAHSE
jgi:hypothetical protein